MAAIGSDQWRACTFFGFLLPQLEKEGKKFNIYLNGKSLDFSYKLPGSNIPLLGVHLTMIIMAKLKLETLNSDYH